VPQHATLFAGTIESNLLMGRKDIAMEDLQMALEAAQASEIVEKKEGKLAEPVLAGGKNFSGGQKQRLTIARALAGKPEIILLDDSASALDLATEAALRGALRSLPWHPTLVVVSQRASSVLSAEQILVLDDGQMMGLGTHSELLEKNETYQEIYYSQYPREEAANA
jgi:ABC-type multidrug transport system fused ATPase/permease subunit